MKRKVFLNTLLLACVQFDLGIAKAALTGNEKNFNLDAMIESLRQVENWDGRSRGAAGERGPWQITPAIWAEISDYPFSWAEGRQLAQRTETRRVAREHVVRIQARLTAGRLSVTPYMVALVWCAGWNAVYYGQPHKPSRAKRDYATRAENLYRDFVANDPRFSP